MLDRVHAWRGISLRLQLLYPDHVPRIRLRHRPRRQCRRRPCLDLDFDLYADSSNMHCRGNPPMLLASATSAVDVLAAAILAAPHQSTGLPSPHVAHLPLAQLPLAARPLQSGLASRQGLLRSYSPVLLVGRNVWITKALGARCWNASSPSAAGSRTHPNRIPPGAALATLSSAAADPSRHDSVQSSGLPARRLEPTPAPRRRNTANTTRANIYVLSLCTLRPR